MAFYQLLGYAEQVSGDDGEWRYTYLKCAGLGLLLAAGTTPYTKDATPLTLYLQVHDADLVLATLRDAGMVVEHLGYPDHAPGGELKVVDPDGYVLLLGQVTGTPPADRDPADGPQQRGSVLRRAALATRRRGVVPPRCQIPALGGTICQAPAEVKLADSWGDSVWACLHHGEELMINAPAAFLAAEDSDGIAAYLHRRTRRPSQATASD